MKSNFSITEPTQKKKTTLNACTADRSMSKVFYFQKTDTNSLEEKEKKYR